MVDALKSLDLFFTQLAASCHVDLMPGSLDPSNFSLPQQPLLSSLFPTARKYNTFELRTNPAWIQVDTLNILVTSGQNLHDFQKYASTPHPIDFLERSLQWRSVAPTAPDTLSCYPFLTDDPFIITHCPHIYFAGNQKEFATKLVHGPEGQKVRLVLVPSFKESGQVVLVNTQTLECHTVNFLPKS